MADDGHDDKDNHRARHWKSTHIKALTKPCETLMQQRNGLTKGIPFRQSTHRNHHAKGGNEGRNFGFRNQ